MRLPTEGAFWLAMLGAVLACPMALGSERIVLAIGNNRGLPGEEPLRYSELDARRFADLFVELGEVNGDRVQVLQAAPIAEIERALSEVKGRVAELRRAGQRVTLLMYYAGHGDERALHIGPERLPLEHLMSLMDAVDADLDLVLIDACRGSGGSRWRGVSRGPSFSVDTLARGPRGRVTITAASPGEPAQESDELGGAVFSHYLMGGLRGPADRDGDAQVTLEEAYAFAHARTIWRTSGSQGAVQRPEYNLKLSGSGPVVLTRTTKAVATLVLPVEANTGYFVFAMQSGSLLAEVPADSEGPARLAVPAGSFLIQKRGPGAWGVARVRLPWGGSVILSPDDFEPVDAQRLALRGGHVVIRDLVMSAGYAGSLWPGRSPGWSSGARAELAYVAGRLHLGVSLSLEELALDFEHFTGTELRLRIGPSASLLLVSSWYTLRLGAGVAIEPTWQHLERRQAERWRAAGLDADERSFAVAFGPVLQVGIAVALGGGFTLDVALSGSATGVPVLGGDSVAIVFRPSAQLCVGFGYVL